MVWNPPAAAAEHLSVKCEALRFFEYDAEGRTAFRKEMEMQELLIIEDNDEINGLLTEMLQKHGYAVKRAFSGTEGLSCFSEKEYALILLDLMLPGKSGEEVLQEIRRCSDVPVIIISAKDGMDGKVDLLSHGADDYITKPFDLREVLARVQLQLKRKREQKQEQKQETLRSGDLEIDQKSREVRICGQPLSLTRQEYRILYLLLSNPDKVFTKQELFEQAWEEYYIGEDKTLGVHISNIRSKLRQYTEVSYIETVWGIGFRAGNRKQMLRKC